MLNYLRKHAPALTIVEKSVIGMLVICFLIFMGWALWRATEKFQNWETPNNKDSCKILNKTHKIVVNTMDAIPGPGTNTRDNINNGINYHDMQSRDIVLGDEKTNWCANLGEEERAAVLNAIGESVDTEVMLFDGGDIMDKNEAASVADGIAYNGDDALLAQV
jgi:hypothetical protein